MTALVEVDRSEELALVAACVRGDAAALDVLDRRYLRELVEPLRAVHPSPAFADEVVQLVRHKLLVGEDGAAPRLAAYAGTGPLGAWLRIVALRIAVDLRRKNWRELPADDGLARFAATAGTPQQELARAEHAAALREALSVAFAVQPSRARALFRYYYVDGVGVEALGKLFRVHASTVSRWLATAREEILAETRRRLASQLAIAESEVESMLYLSGSLELSIDSLLRSREL
jgi:RNA polymerase sigma-70 factor (ECF subfamily)